MHAPHISGSIGSSLAPAAPIMFDRSHTQSSSHGTKARALFRVAVTRAHLSLAVCTFPPLFNKIVLFRTTSQISTMAASTLTYSLSHFMHARSDPVPANLELVRLAFSQTVTAQYLYIVLFSALIYHSIITMEEETKYFWPRPLNSVSLIYFANRYVGLLGAICPLILNTLNISLTSCKFSLWIGVTCNLVTIVLIDYILVLRVLALYHQDRRLAIFLKLLTFLEALIGSSLPIYTWFFSGVGMYELAKGVKICTVKRGLPEAMKLTPWVILMAYGLLLLGLALYKTAGYWRMSPAFKGVYLVKVLIKDQMFYYGFVILSCILQIISIRSGSASVSYILNAAGSPIFLCVLGSQLLVNLKEAGETGINIVTNNRSRRGTNIEFVEVEARISGQTTDNETDDQSLEGHPST